MHRIKADEVTNGSPTQTCGTRNRISVDMEIRGLMYVQTLLVCYLAYIT